jgi:3-oxoadipate enol-lactonase
LGEITQSALVLGGKHDLATPPDMVEALARVLPRADLVMFEDTGHLPAIEAPEAFTRALMTFVERISA